MRTLVAGNWKMNGLAGALRELAALEESLARTPPACDVLICPPATLLAQANWAVKGVFLLGGQDCSPHDQGAYTGDISAAMLKDAGAAFVIVGHSERRRYHGETSEGVAQKALSVWRAGLVAIICVGETEAQRDAGQAHAVCAAQIAASVPGGATAANTVIAYEPIWAVGTGRTPTAQDITAMHRHIRQNLTMRFGPEADGMRLLYGGSVKPQNAGQILGLVEVNGPLVGGASLTAEAFLGIIRAVRAS